MHAVSVGVGSGLGPAAQKPLQAAVKRGGVRGVEYPVQGLALACSRPAVLARFPLADQICDDLVPGRLLGLLQAVQVALQGRVCRLGVILRERLIELAQMSLAFWRIPWEATGDPAQIGLGGASSEVLVPAIS